MRAPDYVEDLENSLLVVEKALDDAYDRNFELRETLLGVYYWMRQEYGFRHPQDYGPTHLASEETDERVWRIYREVCNTLGQELRMVEDA